MSVRDSIRRAQALQDHIDGAPARAREKAEQQAERKRQAAAQQAEWDQRYDAILAKHHERAKAGDAEFRRRLDVIAGRASPHSDEAAE